MQEHKAVSANAHTMPRTQARALLAIKRRKHGDIPHNILLIVNLGRLPLEGSMK